MRLSYLSAVLLSSSLYAGDGDKKHGHPHVDFKSSLNFHNQGLVNKDFQAHKDATEDDTTNFKYKDPKLKPSMSAEATLKWDGEFNDKVGYVIKLSTGGEFKDTYVHIKAHDMFNIGMGRMRINQGGWDHMDRLVTSVWRENPASEMSRAHQTYANALALHILAFGDLNIQLVTDQERDLSTRFYNVDDSITFNLAWHHDFDGIKPLIQFGMYDDFKSMYFNLGVKGMVQGFGFAATFAQNHSKGAKADNKEPDADVISEYSVYLSYAVEKMVTPFFRWSMVDNKQAKDVKHNDVSDIGAATWSDNAMTISAGLEHHYTDNFMPYLSFDMNMGKFRYDNTTADKDLSEFYINLGVTGTI